MGDIVFAIVCIWVYVSVNICMCVGVRVWLI